MPAASLLITCHLSTVLNTQRIILDDWRQLYLKENAKLQIKKYFDIFIATNFSRKQKKEKPGEKKEPWKIIYVM